MTTAIQCPSCRARLTVSEASQGQMVRCPHCTIVMKVPGQPAAPQPTLPPPPVRKAPASNRSAAISAKAPSVVPAGKKPEAIQSPAPRKTAAPPAAANNQPTKKSGRTWMILAGVGVGCGAVVLLLIGLGVAGLIFWRSSSSSEEKTTTAESNPPAEQAPPQPNLGPVAEIPEGPVPAKLDAATLKKVKQATVYLRVKLPNGSLAQGSGFFCMVPGIIMTNAHVLGMLRGSSTAPLNVDVLVHSGEPDERKLTATVLGVDRSNDLAVLRVGGEQLPAPLPVDSAGKLIETQQVYIFGFPHGEQLGKNITVSESSVSSMRRDPSGQLNQIQVNGGMHPGNSGGPVTDARGVVVGVSVAIIEGTQINFAIPGELVKQVLDGRFDKSELGVAYSSDEQIKLPVKMTCLDPLGHIREVKLELWTGAPGASRPASLQPPQPQPGDGPRSTLKANFRDGAYTVEAPLPKPEPGQLCWVQPVLVKVSGETEWEKAIPVSLESQIVLERKPAILKFAPATMPIERSLKVHSAVTITIHQGKQSESMTEKLDGDVLESLNRDARPGKGTAIRLTIGNCPFSRVTKEKTLVPPPQTQAILSKFSPTFLVDDSNAAKERGNRNFNVIVPQYRSLVESMFETICNAYESTTLPLPNRTVQPQEKWQARMPMLVLARGKRSVQDIFVTCIYEGTSSKEGHQEAYIALEGMVKGRGPRAGQVLGKASGHALFDVEKGFLTHVTVTVRSELEMEEAGVRILVEDESTVHRQDGNVLGIHAATRNQP